MLDDERIQKEGVKLIEEFSRMLAEIPDTEETHYVVDLRNVSRRDEASVDKKQFRNKLKKLAPTWEEGYVVAEKGV